MEYISIMKIISETIADGIGWRKSIYCAGCIHQCYNCHNPQTWDIDNGTFLSVQELYNEIMDDNPLLDGITFTGGDPMFQAKSFLELSKMIKANSKYDIWCYTGFLFEDIISNKDDKYELLKMIDVLVDGQYIDDLRDLNIAFRGSKNQRIIDVQESLKQNIIIELDYDSWYFKKIWNSFRTPSLYHYSNSIK